MVTLELSQLRYTI